VITTGVIRAASRAMHEERPTLRADAQAHVRSRLGGKGKLAKSFNVKIYDRKKDRMPQMHIYSKVRWAGTHEYGTVIRGKMLIPLDQKLGTRGARGKTFRQNIEQLRRGGNTIFIKTKKGSVVLMAENIAEHNKPLSGFKSRYRKKHGIKRLKRGAMIPIAILTSQITIKKRTDVVGVVKNRMPKIAGLFYGHFADEWMRG
jgi:hypothetical protein